MPDAYPARDASRGIAMMSAATAILTVNDAIARLLTQAMPVGQFIGLRGVLVVLPILFWVWLARDLRALTPRDVKGQAMRAVCQLFSVALFQTGLSLMTLADAIALLFASPLFTLLLGVLFLGERIGWRRSVALLVGFGGVLIVMRPSSALFRWEALLPLGAALAGGIGDVLARRLSRTDSTFTTFFLANAIVAVAGMLTLPFGWVAPGPRELVLLIACAGFMGVGMYLYIHAFRWAEAGLIGSFRYTMLIWAILLGWLIWGDLPDRWTVAGAALTALAGLFILARERQLKARA